MVDTIDFSTLSEEDLKALFPPGSAQTAQAAPVAPASTADTVDFSALSSEEQQSVINGISSEAGQPITVGDSATEDLADDVEVFPGEGGDIDELQAYTQYGIRGLTSILDIPSFLYNTLAAGAEYFSPAQQAYYAPPGLKGLGFEERGGELGLQRYSGLIPRAVYPSQFIAETTNFGDPRKQLSGEPTELSYEQQREMAPYGFGIEFMTSGFSVAKSTQKAAEISAKKTLAKGGELNRFQAILKSPEAYRKEMQYVGLGSLGAIGVGEMTGGSQGMMIAASMITPSVGVLGSTLRGKLTEGRDVAKVLFSQEGRASMAIDSILRHAKDPEAVILKIQEAMAKSDGGSFNQSLGMLTGDPGIIAFEKGRKGLGFDLKQLDDNGVQMLVAGLDDLVEQGVVGAADDWIRTARDNDLAAIQANVNEAIKHARYAQDNAGTPLAVSESSVVLDDAISLAEKNSEEILRNAWASTRADERLFDPKPIYKELQEMIKSTFTTKTAKAQYKAMFEGDLKILKDLAKSGKPVDINELLDLRSSITTKLRNIPKENRNPFNKKFGIEFQSILLDQVNKNGSGSYNAARDLTVKVKSVFEKSYFTKGEDIGALLADKTFLKGAAGAESVDQIIKASGYNPGIIGATEDVVRASFARAVVDSKTGMIDPAKAKRFLSDSHYGEFLSRPEFRNVRSELEAAADAGQSVKLAELAAKESRAKLQKSAFELWTVKDSNQAIDAIVSGRIGNSTAAVRELKRQVLNDESGEALKGLRQAFLNRLHKDGELIPYATRKKMVPVLKEIFDADQVKRIDSIFKQVDKIRSRKGYSPLPTEKDDALLMSTLGKVLGARIGAQFGQSPLIMANVGGRVMQKIIKDMPRDVVDDITNEIILNPELFMQYKGAINKIEGSGAIDEVTAILHQWALIAGHQAALTTRDPVTEASSPIAGRGER
jgi:hypothetical protein